ncbi:hypothetical protein C1C98_16345 [Pseudomonas ogarae]|uniref:Uncharacterized protein n=1 Tax=Pseudomonas ogarae (strain DSM 112162 / CECT 30235 / F113) TaxID=1114970 RepID=A0ABN5G6G4_PSEO1|nr:hypothetical protein C1C98_16345 [Pseudomonas ogarae]
MLRGPTPQYLRSAIVVNGAPQIKIKSEAALKPACFEASTVGVHSLCTRHKNLLAKASAQPTSTQAEPPLSRASPLPQEKRGFTKSQVGCQAASRGGARSNVRAEP